MKSTSSNIKRVVTIKTAQQKLSPEKQQEPDPALSPVPNPCSPEVPAPGTPPNEEGELGPGDVACGILPTSFYPIEVVQQFTAIVNASQLAILLRSLARNCPLLDPNSVNVATLSLVGLCPGKYQVKFVPGNTIGLVDPDAEDPIGTIQTSTDIFNASLALQRAGISLKNQSTQEVLAVLTDVGVSGVYADIVERFFGNVDLVSISGADETGLLIIVEVPPEQLFFAQQILNTPREDLDNPEVLPCYVCPDLPTPGPVEECKRPPLNCNFFWPCCKADCKDACKDKKKKKCDKKKPKKDDRDSDSDSDSDSEKEDRGFKGDGETCGCRGGKKH